MKIVILYSGGLDSLLMYHLAKQRHPNDEVKCVFYAHGQDAEEQELKSLPDFVEVRKIDWLGENIKPLAKKSDPFAGAIYIPGRNLVFSVLCACQEVADQIWMGTVWDEDNQQATDKNHIFRRKTSELLSYVLSPFVDNVTIRFPFVENQWTKEDAVAWALSSGISASEITSSVSCWHQHGDKPCGECKQCLKRMLVFGLNDIKEEYVVHPLDSEQQHNLILDYLDAFLTRSDLNVDELNVVDMLLRFFKKYEIELDDQFSGLEGIWETLGKVDDAIKSQDTSMRQGIRELKRDKKKN